MLKRFSTVLIVLSVVYILGLMISLWPHNDKLKTVKNSVEKSIKIPENDVGLETTDTQGDLPETTAKPPERAQIYDEIRIFCIIITAPKNLDTRARYVKETWAKDCSHSLYISEEGNSTFPAIKVANFTGWKHLWAKTRNSFTLAYEEYLNEADWFLKADDDTYINIHNLKKFLANKDPDKDLSYYGKFFKPWVKGGYNSGGAGYVFGREALRRLNEIGFKDTEKCSNSSVAKAEDIQIAFCLHASGIKTANNTVDAQKRELFHGLSPQNEHALKTRRVAFYWQYSIYPLGDEQCCSPEVISYHYVRGPEMLWVDYLVKTWRSANF